MNGNDIALDTNQAIHILNDVPEVVRWLNGFARLFLPVPVIGELRFGAMKSARPAPNLARVDALATRCVVLDCRASTANHYARLRIELQRLGRPIPENDIWIAAACIEHNLPLATDDAHFDAVAGLAVLRQPGGP